jgi:hypothetical protein
MAAVSRAKLRRNAQYQLDHPDVHRAAQARYELTKAGQETHRRYYTSERGRKVGREYKKFIRQAAKRGYVTKEG